MISGLRSIAQAVTPIALDIYDKLDSSSVFGVLAQLVPNPGREKVVTVEWWSAFPQLRKWIGERTVQRAFQNSLVIPGGSRTRSPWSSTGGTRNGPAGS